MNEELEELLKASGEKVMEYVEAGEGFLQEQTPLLVREIIVYEIGFHTFFALFFLVLIFVGVWSTRKAWVWSKDPKHQCYNDQEWSKAWGMLSILLACVSFMFMIRNLVSSIKPILAPRLFLLEKLGSLF
jgi:hypothetical protein